MIKIFNHWSHGIKTVSYRIQMQTLFDRISTSVISPVEKSEVTSKNKKYLF